MGRQLAGLQATGQQVKEVSCGLSRTTFAGRTSHIRIPSLYPSAAVSSQICPSALVVEQAADLSDLDSVEPSLDSALSRLESLFEHGASSAGPSPRFSRAILVNNVGSLGEIAPVRDIASLAFLRSTIDLNVTSTIWISALFLRRLPSLVAATAPGAGAGAGAGSSGGSASANPALPSAIVNISSLAAVKAFKTQLVYCVGKAARDMLHAGMGEELADPQHAPAGIAVKTLNYAPGPMDTDMQREIRESSTLDPGMKVMFRRLKEENTLVDADASATKCAAILASNTFTSGAHIDFYDA
jgi:NAD(P)-dependent dehydrogenase (short-subunit alcohol dehydrogenase family)